jgi:hypothetical protein
VTFSVLGALLAAPDDAPGVAAPLLLPPQAASRKVAAAAPRAAARAVGLREIMCPGSFDGGFAAERGMQVGSAPSWVQARPWRFAA